MTWRLLLLAAAIVGTAPWAYGQWIRSVDPPGWRPGATVTVELDGVGLHEPTGLLLGADASVEWLEGDQEGRTIRARVRLSGDTPLGLIPLRLATAHGISNVKPIVVDELPLVREQEPNNSPRFAQLIPLNVAIAGTLDRGSRDYYRFRVRAGQYVVVEVFCRRLDSGVDPQLRLLDETGKHLLAWADDTPGLWQDCRVRRVFAKEGEYLVELSDVRLQGGPGAAYWMRIGELPEGRFCLPMAVPRGQEASVMLIGSVVHRKMLRVRAPKALDRFAFFAPVPTGRSPYHGFVPLLLDDLEEVLEREPNDHWVEANRIRIPCAVNGVLARRGDQDVYLFRARRGVPIELRATSRWLNSGADLTLAVRDAQGRELAFCDDSGVDDAAIVFTPPQTGWYSLVVSELHYRGGPDAVYRVRIAPAGPQFELSLWSVDEPQRSIAAVAVPRGGSVACRLKVKRRYYDGPIELRPVGLPPGVGFGPLRLPEGVDEALVTFTASSDVPRSAAWVRLVGYGQTESGYLQRFVRFDRAVAAELGLRFAPPIQHALALAVVREKSAAIEPEQGSIELQPGGRAALTVRLQTDSAVILDAVGLPPYVECSAVEVPAGPRRAALLLKAAKDAPPGWTTFVVRARVGQEEVVSRAVELTVKP